MLILCAVFSTLTVAAPVGVALLRLEDALGAPLCGDGERRTCCSCPFYRYVDGQVKRCCKLGRNGQRSIIPAPVIVEVGKLGLREGPYFKDCESLLRNV